MRDLTLAVLLLAACTGQKGRDSALQGDSTPAPEAAPAAPAFVMLCGADTISVHGASTDSVLQLHAFGETFLVGHVPSASGARYQAGADTGTFYWNHGGQSTVRIRGEALPECEMIP